MSCLGLWGQRTLYTVCSCSDRAELLPGTLARSFRMGLKKNNNLKGV